VTPGKNYDQNEEENPEEENLKEENLEEEEEVGNEEDKEETGKGETQPDEETELDARIGLSFEDIKILRQSLDMEVSIRKVMESCAEEILQEQIEEQIDGRYYPKVMIVRFILQYSSGV
jgi:hypothetical protein